MKNKHDEIKDLLKASRNLLTNSLVKEETERIKQTRKETSSHTHEPTTVLKLAQAGLAK